MLEQLLNLIRSSGTVSPAELGRRMNIDPRMVAVLMEDLQRRGLIHDYEMPSSCTTDGCDGCYLSSGCQNAKPRIWEISDPS